ncbi:hypothetical protein DY000_02047578 [Brassica cretica]|uniref:Uncharacterized protein n=1 Tax=Brassica cretica TaxID=69181 RepID=A0ABQ7EUX1_BRACR|nr:hypothetical protein DY000_02047578 [Brassica cretica]
MMNNTRKGYAIVEDITKISIARASAINGGGRNHLEAEGRELYLAPWRWWWSEFVYLTGASFCQLLHDTERFQFINSVGKGPLGAHVKHAKHGDNYPAGAAAVDLNVAYRMSWRICSTDSKENIVYPNNFKPQNELLKIGLKPVMNTTQRRAAAQIQGVQNKPIHKKKKQEISKIWQHFSYQILGQIYV